MDFGPTARYDCWKRPGVDEFLDYLFDLEDRELCCIAVWTASTADYANRVCILFHFVFVTLCFFFLLVQVVSEIFGERRKRLRCVWSREQCTPYERPVFKELSIMATTIGTVC